MRNLVFLSLITITNNLSAQSLYLPQGDKHQQFLERLEIMLQKNPELNIASARTISRHDAVHIAGLEDSSSGNPTIKLTKVDQANLQSLLRNNAEWVTRLTDDKRGFYRNPANMIEVNKEKFFLAVNPMLQAEYSKETDYDQQVYHYAAGIGIRSMIGAKVGLYASAVRHTERVPSFVLDRVNEYNSLPGAGKLDRFGANGFNYWDVRGGFTFKALKYFDFTVAYDRNFIGNGYRSLFLSDFAKNYVYGKAVTRIWKFRYTHIYAPFIMQFEGNRETKWPVGRKMTAMHHLSISPTRWLNIAVFQAVSISKRDDWLYMMPVIFYPVSSVKTNKPANDLAGFEFKANIAKRTQFYGQFLADNINLKMFTNSNGWWNNRYGIQIGLKALNLFRIKNFDAQVELNAVRPYTYAADSLGSYNHYNQHLAHPSGASFLEGIFLLRYKPNKQLTISMRAISWRQGMDTAQLSFGNNIRKSTHFRVNEYGFTLVSGAESNNFNLKMSATYEFIENGFAEISACNIAKKYESSFANKSFWLITAGVRFNIFQRFYDF